jgi:hypothetical protein
MQHLPLPWWKSEVAAVAPVGHALRQVLTSNWTRFHSLPESKRYAENDRERDELRHRHLTVANTLFREGESIYVYRSRYYEKRLKGKAKHLLAGRQLQESVVQLPAHLGAKSTDEDEILSVRALTTAWQPDFYLELLHQIADDRETGISFVAPQSKNIYCPYDGGLDVFSFSVSAAEPATRYSQWQSSRPDRL